MKPSATLFGLHPVRIMLQKFPDRVVSVRIADRRDDARTREIEALARNAGRPVERIEMRVLQQMSGEVAHQRFVLSELGLER